MRKIATVLELNIFLKFYFIVDIYIEVVIKDEHRSCREELKYRTMLIAWINIYFLTTFFISMFLFILEKQHLLFYVSDDKLFDQHDNYQRMPAIP